MITTMLYSNKTVLNNMYNNALHKIRGMGIFYVLVSFVFFPLQYFLTLANGTYSVNGQVFYNFIGSADIYTYASALLFIPFLMVMAVIMPISLNSYMHSKNAVDTYHALPVTRTQMLKANLLASFTWLVVPLAMWFILITFGNFITNQTTIALIWIEFLKLSANIFSVLAIASIVSVTTCGVLDAGLFTFALNGAIPAIALLLEGCFSTMLYGYIENIRNIEYAFYTSPMAMSISSLIFSSESSYYRKSLIASGIWFILSFAIMYFAFKIYNKRNSEYAQSFDTTGVIYRLLGGAATFFVGVGFTMVMTHLFFNKEYSAFNIAFVLFAALGGLIAFIALEAVLSRSFKITKYRIKALAFSLLLPIGFSVALLSGGIGFETYVPKIEDISTVSINYVGEYDSVAYATEGTVNFEGESRRYYDFSGAHSSVFKEVEAKKIVAELHQNIIDMGEQRYNNNNYRYRSFNIEYTTNSGKSVKRYYNTFLTPEIVNKLVDLTDTKEYLFQHNPIILSTADQIEGIQITDGFATNLMYPQLSAQEIEILHEAISRDLIEQTTKDKFENSGVLLAQIKVLYKKSYQYIGRDGKEGYIEPYSNVVYSVNSGSKNTIEALKQIGLEKYAEVNTEEITTGIVGFSTNKYDIVYSRDAVLYSNIANYHDINQRMADLEKHNVGIAYKTQDRELIEYLVKNVKHTLPTTADYCVVVFAHQDTNSLEFVNTENAYYYLEKDKVPQELQQAFKEYAADRGYNYEETIEMGFSAEKPATAATLSENASSPAQWEHFKF